MLYDETKHKEWRVSPFSFFCLFWFLFTSETSPSTQFTGLSLERASSKDSATCTHLLLLPNQTRTHTNSHRRSLYSPLPKCSLSLSTLRLQNFNKQNYALFTIILFALEFGRFPSPPFVKLAFLVFFLIDWQFLQ